MVSADKRTVENPRAYGRKSDIVLTPGEFSASYIVSRLKRSNEPMRIKCDTGNWSKREMSVNFGLLLDAINADIWMKANVLQVDTENFRITFSNKCIIFFK